MVHFVNWRWDRHRTIVARRRDGDDPQTIRTALPISRACELLEPRWTIQIIAELWNGSTRFNDIRRAVGNISSALLSNRLKELEELGLIERLVDPATDAVDYFRTERAIKLEPALNALAEWAQCNIEADVFLSGMDVSTLMWGIRRHIEISELPMQ